MNKSTLIAFSLILFTFLSAGAETKIGTVDMLKLIRNHSSYDTNRSLVMETEKDYQKKIDRIKTELADVEDELKKLMDQYSQPMLSANAKAKIEKDSREVQSKGMALQQRLRSEAMRSQQDLQDLEARLLRSTSKDVRAKIKVFAEKNGYDLVVDHTAAPYYNPKLDVTNDVLKEMGVDPAKALEAEDIISGGTNGGTKTKKDDEGK